jgi:hypothetical protein
MKGSPKVEMGGPALGLLARHEILCFSPSKHLLSATSSHLLSHLCCLQISPIENLLVVVHPDFSQAHLVASNDTCALGKGVGTLGTEHVAYHRAGNDLQLAPALPHLTQEEIRRRLQGVVVYLLPSSSVQFSGHQTPGPRT